MKKITYAALLTLPLQWAGTASYARPQTLAEKKAVEAVVKPHLKDPNSAIFQHPPLQLSGRNDGKLYCGYVNAKNSYGGYTGNTLFLAGFVTEIVKGKDVTTAKFVTMGDSDSDSDDSQVVRKMCQDYPHPSE